MEGCGGDQGGAGTRLGHANEFPNDSTDADGVNGAADKLDGGASLAMSWQ
jgi:hypothetical protein